jgi:hypothetical protein
MILVIENTEKQGDYESLLPPREGSWTPTSKLFLQQIKMKMVKELFANPLKGRDGLPNEMMQIYSWKG